MNQPHILIVGSGSVGRRHARNFAALGCQISCIDLRADRRAELANETSIVDGFPDLQVALTVGGFDGVVVGTPTVCHPENTIAALEAGLPVLLEKPVAKSAVEAQQVLEVERRTGIPVLLGYTWRWWPPLARVRNLLLSGRIGMLRHVQFHMSVHLADWHPWEPYQEFFMANAAQGGGALLDESHWIDLMLWLFGMPKQLVGQVEKISDLYIDTDDTVDARISYLNGLRVTLHLDLYGRPHEKFIRFIGEKGTLMWSAEPNRIAIGMEAGQIWSEETYTHERNEMFMAEAREFIDIVATRTLPSCTLKEGFEVMKLIEAIRTSNAEGRTIEIAISET